MKRTAPILALAALLGLAPGAAVAELKLDVKYSTYDVQGLTAEEIHADIDRKSPSDQDGIILGSADDALDWEIDLEPAGRSCRVRQAEVSLQVEITLPAWADRDRGSPEVQALWDRYYAKLKAHEDRHKEIAVDAARELDALLTGAGADGSCDTLKEDLNRRAEQVLAREEQVQTQFDRLESADPLIEF